MIKLVYYIFMLSFLIACQRPKVIIDNHNIEFLVECQLNIWCPDDSIFAFYDSIIQGVYYINEQLLGDSQIILSQNIASSIYTPEYQLKLNFQANHNLHIEDFTFYDCGFGVIEYNECFWQHISDSTFRIYYNMTGNFGVEYVRIEEYTLSIKNHSKQLNFKLLNRDIKGIFSYKSIKDKHYEEIVSFEKTKFGLSKAKSECGWYGLVNNKKEWKTAPLYFDIDLQQSDSNAIWVQTDTLTNEDFLFNKNDNVGIWRLTYMHNNMISKESFMHPMPFKNGICQVYLADGITEVVINNKGKIIQKEICYEKLR